MMIMPGLPRGTYCITPQCSCDYRRDYIVDTLEALHDAVADIEDGPPDWSKFKKAITEANKVINEEKP